MPIKNYDAQKKEHRQFLLLGGKAKTFRTALTSLLYFEGLDKCGYISYFGFKPLNTFTNETKDMYFMTDSPNEQKRRVEIGLEKMGLTTVLLEISGALGLLIGLKFDFILLILEFNTLIILTPSSFEI